jgi:membrane protein implicated in regulation of membrane protease activity
VGTPRLLIVFTLAVIGVVLIVAALATGEWWLLPVALLAHAIATTVTVVAIGRTADQAEKPDPVTEARIEEESDESDQGDQAQGEDDEPRMAI